MKSFFILFFIGFLAGSAFAETQLNPENAIQDRVAPGKQLETNIEKPDDKTTLAPPENNKKNTDKFINVKVSGAADSGKIRVIEIFVHRGSWVQSDAVLAILDDGEKEIYVRSPDTGVVMKVLAKQGDSVSQGTALIQLKKAGSQRPNFQRAWKFFSLMNVSVASVGKRLGGKVRDNINIQEEDKGKWKNACAVRMSFVLNNTGFPIKEGKYPTVSAQIKGLYIYRIDDMISYLRDTFGDPDIAVNRSPKPEDFSGMQGILVVTGDGRGDARGHVTLWDGSACSDICRLTGDENNTNFTPHKAVLWVLP
ncbi:MAG: hypothetical protein LBE22_07210 [Azoarcus sp.]|nr:hypothetical protein [Azoarcus sp.]